MFYLNKHVLQSQATKAATARVIEQREHGLVRLHNVDKTGTENR
jgi:hypothetical protein